MLNPLNLSRGFRIGGPGANSTSIATTQKYKSDDPIRQGFFDSTFFKPNARSTADMANYTYNGKSMQGSSSQIGQFGNYLDSIGKGDLLQRQNNSFTQQPGIGGLLSSTPGLGNATPGPVDPIMQGFKDSEFRKNANMMQQDAVNFKYDGKDMMMNGSMSGAFKQYLDSIGKGDLYQGMGMGIGGLLSSTPGENPYERRGPIPPSLLNLKPRNPDQQMPTLQQADPNNLMFGTMPPTGGTFNGMPLQPGNKYIDNLPGKNFMEQLPGNTMPENTMGGNNSFGNPLMGGINNLSEFGKPPSFGGNSFGNTMGGNNVFQNPFTGFQSNQQSFNDNQGMSSYIDNLINQRMKDIFGGIMGIFK